MTTGWRASLIGTGALLCLGVLPLGAQQTPAGQERADTTQEVDSTRVRIQEQLDALGRAPGADSARLARDSAALAERSGGGGEDGARGSDPVQDSLSGALLDLEGYAPTGYSGTSAEFDAARRQLTLRGDEDERPEVSREGMVLSADSAIVYDEGSERVRTYGSSEYTPDAGDAVESRSMVLDLPSEQGSALGARTRYSQGGTEWIIRGDLPSVGSDVVYGSHTDFTSCELEEPHYHFESDQIKVHAGNVLVARPVRLYFADVPVAWLPFIAQSLGEGRASGLLTPRFSVNDIVRTSQGYNRRISNVGFYWAMSDYTDGSLALDWFSDRFTAVNGTFRYNWMRQFLDGSANVNHYWSADGSTELALNSSHQWRISERTRFSAQGRFVTSNDFVRENSFDPREVTQTIRSQGGLNHTFDWGSVNVGANRQQFLSDDRVEMTLPDVSLNLNPITFLQAPPSQARFYNNLTWNGSVNANRSLQDFPGQPVDSAFQTNRLDQVRTRAGLSNSLSLGNVSISQSLNYSRDVRRGMPDFLLSPLLPVGSRSVAARLAAGLPVEDASRIDLGREEISWSAGTSYQQRLIGSTTLTPRVSIQGRAIRSDTLSAASGVVSAPTRASAGARLKTDIFGFYPGAGSFDRIRHKLSPSVSWDYSPEVTPTELQRRVFGSGEIQTRSVTTIKMNQTFEASVAEDAEEAADTALADTGPLADTVALDEAASDTAAAPDTPERGGAATDAFDDEGLERMETTRKVTLLALETSAVTYDFVEADSTGTFLGGFQTTTLNNNVRSDYLQGLSFQLQHDLFRTPTGGGAGRGGGPGVRESGRAFDPHLSSVNLSFSVNSSSTVFQWLGLAGGDAGGGAPESGARREEGEDAFGPGEGTDESSIVPGEQRDAGGTGGRSTGGVGQWRADFSYSLQRPRLSTAARSQMLQATVNFQPTEHWDVNWRTSFDVERQLFNDHMIRLTRELHRWEANFDFRKTATGNWSFRFEVRLLDNQDLHFDYEQRSQLPR